jgi:hypothetical protein
MSVRDRQFIASLRDQAERCYRTAEKIGDPEFARALVRVGMDLEWEADGLEQGRGRVGTLLH